MNTQKVGHNGNEKGVLPPAERGSHNGVRTGQMDEHVDKPDKFGDADASPTHEVPVTASLMNVHLKAAGFDVSDEKLTGPVRSVDARRATTPVCASRCNSCSSNGSRETRKRKITWWWFLVLALLLLFVCEARIQRLPSFLANSQAKKEAAGISTGSSLSALQAKLDAKEETITGEKQAPPPSRTPLRLGGTKVASKNRNLDEEKPSKEKEKKPSKLRDDDDGDGNDDSDKPSTKREKESDKNDRDDKKESGTERDDDKPRETPKPTPRPTPRPKDPDTGSKRDDDDDKPSKDKKKDRDDDGDDDDKPSKKESGSERHEDEPRETPKPTPRPTPRPKDPDTGSNRDDDDDDDKPRETPKPTPRPTERPKDPDTGPEHDEANSKQPRQSPATEDPTRDPTREPTRPPETDPPSDKPTKDPTRDPTREPTKPETDPPTDKPVEDPTRDPTREPTKPPNADSPTDKPVEDPTRDPTKEPTKPPETDSPTGKPTDSPTKGSTSPPTKPPETDTPVEDPTREPTREPTKPPTDEPIESSTPSPTKGDTPVTSPPTRSPTEAGTPSPTKNPTPAPTKGEDQSPEPTKKPNSVPVPDEADSEPQCGNGQVDSGEECDPQFGSEDAAGGCYDKYFQARFGKLSCNSNCKCDGCGNGKWDSGEECDKDLDNQGKPLPGTCSEGYRCNRNCKCKLISTTGSGPDSTPTPTPQSDATPEPTRKPTPSPTPDGAAGSDPDPTSGDSPTPDPTPQMQQCGNGKIDSGEECDPSFGSEDAAGGCYDKYFRARFGKLSCNSDCKCDGCGNGKLDGDEECDKDLENRGKPLPDTCSEGYRCNRNCRCKELQRSPQGAPSEPSTSPGVPSQPPTTPPPSPLQTAPPQEAPTKPPISPGNPTQPPTTPPPSPPQDTTNGGPSQPPTTPRPPPSFTPAQDPTNGGPPPQPSSPPGSPRPTPYPSPAPTPREIPEWAPPKPPSSTDIPVSTPRPTPLIVIPKAPPSIPSPTKPPAHEVIWVTAGPTASPTNQQSSPVQDEGPTPSSLPQEPTPSPVHPALQPVTPRPTTLPPITSRPPSVQGTVSPTDSGQETAPTPSDPGQTPSPVSLPVPPSSATDTLPPAPSTPTTASPHSVDFSPSSPISWPTWDSISTSSAPSMSEPTVAPTEVSVLPMQGWQASDAVMVLGGIEPLDIEAELLWTAITKEYIENEITEVLGQEQVESVEVSIGKVLQNPPYQASNTAETRNRDADDRSLQDMTFDDLHPVKQELTFDVLILLQSVVTEHGDVNKYIVGAFDQDEEKLAYMLDLQQTGHPVFANVTSVSVMAARVVIPLDDRSNNPIDPNIKPEGGNTASASRNGLAAGLTVVAIVGMLLAGVVFLRGRRHRNMLVGPPTAQQEGRRDNRRAPQNHPDGFDDSLIEVGTADVSSLGDPFPPDICDIHSTTDSKSSAFGSSINTPSLDYDFIQEFRQVAASLSLDSDTANSASLVTKDDNTLEAEYFQFHRFEVEAPSGRLGIVLETSNGGAPVVQAISESSPLAGQISEGDTLLTVDGIDVTEMTASDVSDIISSKETNPVRHFVFAMSPRMEYDVSVNVE